MIECDLMIIGGGPAGMAAALGAREAGCGSIWLVERSEHLGGILNQCVHSGFGLTWFGEELTGPQYAERFIRQVQDADINVLTDTAVIDVKADGTSILSGPNCGIAEVQPKAVILASGCRERPIGALPVTGTRPAGIFTAGAAQKMVNLGGYDIGRRFIILGSGDVGLIMARQLTLLGKTVLAVIEKEDRCGGLERNRLGCLEAYHIPLLTRTTITRIHGVGRIEGVTVLNLDTGKDSFVPCDTLITSVGLIPERELAEGAAGDNNTLPDWLFLCGNACFVHDLVDDVTAEGIQVGREAARFIREGSRSESQMPALAGHKESSSNDSDLICIACPKSCRLTKTAAGYTGMLCGRKDPLVRL